MHHCHQNYDEMREGRIHTLLSDVERLLLVYKTPIVQSALHVYHSALVTMPSCLLLKEAAPRDGHGIPVLVSKRAEGWSVRETILEVERATVECVAYSSNGKLIASVARNSAVQVWDVATGMEVHTMRVYDADSHEPSESEFTSVAFSLDSQWIVSGGEDYRVRLWNATTGEQHCVMNGHTGPVRSVTISPDGIFIVSCSDDSTLRVWDLRTHSERAVMTGHTKSVCSVAFAPNGRTVVSGSEDGTLRVWDGLTGNKLHVMHGDGSEINHVSFSPDGLVIGSGSSKGIIQLWSATGSVMTRQWRAKYGVQSLAFSPDSRYVLSCDGQALVHVWNVTTGIEKHSLRDGVTCAVFSPDGKSIAMGLREGTIRVWDADISTMEQPINNDRKAEIFCVSFSPDGLWIASGSMDQTVRIWDVIAGTERRVMKAGDAVISIAFSPDNRSIACGQANGTVQLWDAASGLKQSSLMGPHIGMVIAQNGSVAFSSDGKSIASYSALDGTGRVWDVATGAEQHILRCQFGADEPRYSLAMPLVFSPNGKKILLKHDLPSGVVFVLGSWDLGTVHSNYIESSLQEEVQPVDDSQRPERHDPELLGFRLGGSNLSWICRPTGEEEARPICWLPQDLRGTFAFSGTKVCVGSQNGTVTILDFSHVSLPQKLVMMQPL
jgi:WD40 repeat protein